MYIYNKSNYTRIILWREIFYITRLNLLLIATSLMKTEIIIQTSWQSDSGWTTLSVLLTFWSCPNPLLFYQLLQSFWQLFTEGTDDAILGASLILSQCGHSGIKHSPSYLILEPPKFQSRRGSPRWDGTHGTERMKRWNDVVSKHS